MCGDSIWPQCKGGTAAGSSKDGSSREWGVSLMRASISFDAKSATLKEHWALDNGAVEQTYEDL